MGISQTHSLIQSKIPMQPGQSGPGASVFVSDCKKAELGGFVLEPVFLLC